MSGKNILILSGMKLFPSLTGGHLHTTGIARALAQLGHRVRIYSLAGRREDYRFAPSAWSAHTELEFDFGLVEETNLRLDYGLIQTFWRQLGRPRSWQYRLLASGRVPARLEQAMTRADCVFCDLPYCPPVPGPWLTKPWYLISHNLEHRLLEQGTPTERRYAPWMKAVETSAAQRYRDICACAEEDQTFFRANDPAGLCRVPMVGSAIDPTRYTVPPGTRERVRAELGVADDETLVVFAGSRFQPNLDALATLKAFCRDEAAFLRHHRIRFLALGSMEASAYHDGALQATGRVPEVAPYFAAADIGLNPVTWGSGANVKLFEYLAVRLPILSTRIGVRGTELVAGIDYTEFDETTLKEALLGHFRHRRAEWLSLTEAVWQRHRHYGDIVAVVEAAVAQLRDFN